MLTRAANHIWGLVCGYAEPTRSRRWLFMLRAFFDDSKMDGPYAALAGWVEQPDRWARFSNDWDDVLRMSPRIAYFKWKEARGLSDEFLGISPERRDEKINLLAGVIGEYAPLGVVSVVSLKLHRQIFGENPDRILRNPYFLSFHSVVTQLVMYPPIQRLGEKIDFIFDTQPGQMEAAIGSWERLKQVAPPQVKSLIGSANFGDDTDVKPLQAADLSAGWIREQAEAYFSGAPIPEAPWGDRANHVQCLTRIWTADLYKDLADRTGAFEVPKNADS
jgi:hypothetical protein